MSGTTCPICYSDAIRENVSQVENIWPTARAVNYCTSCQVYYLASMPTEAELVSYYKNDYYRFPVFLDLIKRAFRRSRSMSQYRYIQDAICLSGGKVLEVGACDGMLLEQFAGQNEVVGLELSDKYRASAKQRYGVKLLDEKFDDFEGRFDLLIMSHVLEHFPDIDRAMEKALSLIKPRGYFFIEVPNSPLPSECSRTGLKSYLATAHTVNFTTQSLRHLLGRFSLELVSINRFSYNLPSFYSAKRRAKVAEILIGGDRSPKYAGDVLLYLAKILTMPRLAFKPVTDITSGYQELGDNIRALVRLRAA
jgi:SAM-dependent methyltransferase